MAEQMKTMQVTEEEENLILEIRQLGYGETTINIEARVVVKGGKPVMLHEKQKDVKLTR